MSNSTSWIILSLQRIIIRDGRQTDAAAARRDASSLTFVIYRSPCRIPPRAARRPELPARSLSKSGTASHTSVATPRVFAGRPHVLPRRVRRDAAGGEARVPAPVSCSGDSFTLAVRWASSRAAMEGRRRAQGGNHAAAVLFRRGLQGSRRRQPIQVALPLPPHPLISCLGNEWMLSCV
jgi:hypothetical protein